MNMISLSGMIIFIVNFIVIVIVIFIFVFIFSLLYFFLIIVLLTFFVFLDSFIIVLNHLFFQSLLNINKILL